MLSAILTLTTMAALPPPPASQKPPEPTSADLCSFDSRLDRRIAPEHVRLGLWCEANGLKPEALAHFTTALKLDPYHEATWHHLGYVKHQGRWMHPEQIAADQREALAQRHADRH
jgi:hypothetical protein